MENKLAIDFGNSNTVLALWNAEAQRSETLRLDGYSMADGFVIPSLIHYVSAEKILIGQQVLAAGLLSSPQTFRWMKRYISLRSPYSIQTAPGKISARQAAEDFLKLIEVSAFAQAAFDPDEITLSVPLEAFEHYENWLAADRAQNADRRQRRIRIIDEASAAAAGYEETVHAGDALLLLDFGGSTLQAVVAAVREAPEAKETAGRFCTVAGKSACGIGGATLDTWIYEEICRDHHLLPQGIEGCSRALLQRCEQLKLDLSEAKTAHFEFRLPDGRLLSTEYERAFLNRLFEKRGLYRILHERIREALLQAADHGYPQDRIKKVIPVGGGCRIPAVLDLMAGIMGEATLLKGEPMGAVARGAACFAGGMDIYDFIQHDYAVRYRDPASGEYAFQPIIRKGTPYPSSGPVAALKVKASFENQQLLGLAIYEISHQSVLPADHYEILFDERGEVRLFPLGTQEQNAQLRHWMNERTPSFLKAEPPAQKGQPRFETLFEISPNKMLLLTATDLETGKILFDKFPVIRLS